MHDAGDVGVWAAGAVVSKCAPPRARWFLPSPAAQWAKMEPRPSRGAEGRICHDEIYSQSVDLRAALALSLAPIGKYLESQRARRAGARCTPPPGALRRQRRCRWCSTRGQVQMRERGLRVVERGVGGGRVGRSGAASAPPGAARRASVRLRYLKVRQNKCP